MQFPGIIFVFRPLCIYGQVALDFRDRLPSDISVPAATVSPFGTSNGFQCLD